MYKDFFREKFRELNPEGELGSWILYYYYYYYYYTWKLLCPNASLFQYKETIRVTLKSEKFLICFFLKVLVSVFFLNLAKSGHLKTPKIRIFFYNNQFLEFWKENSEKTHFIIL